MKQSDIDELRRRIERGEGIGYKQLTVLMDEIERLQARIEKLEAALRFYADKSNYKACICRHYEHSVIDHDEGATAREALEGK